MIFEFILTALLGLVQAAVDAVLPVAEAAPFSVTSGWFHGYAWLDGMFPVHVVFQIIGAYLALKLLLIGFRLAVTMYHLIPVIG